MRRSHQDGGIGKLWTRFLPQTQPCYNYSGKNYPGEKSENWIKRTPTTRESPDWGRKDRNFFWRKGKPPWRAVELHTSQAGTTVRYAAFPVEVGTLVGTHYCYKHLSDSAQLRQVSYYLALWASNCNKGILPEKLLDKSQRNLAFEGPMHKFNYLREQPNITKKKAEGSFGEASLETETLLAAIVVT